MIAGVRSAYNRHYSDSKYEAFLADLDGLYDHKITFRVAETPVFVGRDFKDKLIKSSAEIIDFLVSDEVKQLTDAAFLHT